MHNDIAPRRSRLRLSQAELARKTGLSRQLISAVETGRHAPSVKAALAIAEVLGASVEEIFGRGDIPARHVPALGEEPPENTGVVAVRVGDSLVYHPVSNRGAGEGSWQRADGIFREGAVHLFEDADPSGLAVAGCDPALGLAAALLPARGPRRLVSIATSTGRALEALHQGRLHAALVHGPRRRREIDVRPGRCWTFAAWRVGLAARGGDTVDLERLAQGELQAAMQGPGAEAQAALERALAPLGGSSRLRGPAATGHLDAARHVIYRSADTAVTMEPAAQAFDLDFLALEEHVVELRIAEDWVDHPGAQALVDVIVSQPFRRRLESLGGYDLTEVGRDSGS